MNQPPDSRLAEEERFHDRVHATGNRAAANPFYAVAGPARRRYRVLVDAHATRGRDVLELGCGAGQTAVRLALRGARVVAVDVSSEGLGRAAGRARAARLGPDNPVFRQMDAAALAFPDDRFDLVVGSGILHHVDMPSVCRELPRVLRPGGRAVCSWSRSATIR